jgi:protein-disulfide isomerase
MNRIFTAGFFLALIFLTSCKTDKKVSDLVKKLEDTITKLEARIEALEKIVLPPKEEPFVQESAYNIPIGESYVLGDKNADVSIVVFSNFQCPYCSRADKALRELRKDEELKDKINIVFKHFPFERHVEARPAAKAALAAGEQGKFWEMTEIIFANQGDMNQQNYEKWAAKIGLKMEKFKQDLKKNDKKYDELIEKDVELGVKEAKLEGTPWILVGGWLLEGEINPATIKKMIKKHDLDKDMAEKHDVNVIEQ